MKTKITILAIFIISLVMLSACRKQVENGNTDFIGYWSGGTYNEYGYVYVHINENSKAYFHINDRENEHDYITKGTARADHEKLSIGGIKYFKIVQYPHPIDTNVERKLILNHVDNTWKVANWKMVLDGLHGTTHSNLGNHTYYKADY
jgi:hypothetical protein